MTTIIAPAQSAAGFDFAARLKGESPEFIAAFCIWCEARGAIFAAKLGVGFVIRNRVKAGREFGSGDVLSVVTKPYAFSSLDAGDPNYLTACNFLQNPGADTVKQSWQDCDYAAELAMSAGALDPTDGALFYHDSSIAQPPVHWGKVALTAKLGNLSFYARV